MNLKYINLDNYKLDLTIQIFYSLLLTSTKL